ncbi:MAG: ATPase [Candidatus Nitrosothermus koennekii]|nr:MAG: ATPase [Candidatus Nitrosothermus koennekii]
MSILKTRGKEIEELEEFLKGFRNKEGRFKYRERIASMKVKDQRYIVIDHHDLVLFNQTIAYKLTNDPDNTLASLKEAVYQVLKITDPDYAEKIKEEIRVRIGNYPIKVPIRNVDASMIGKLVSVAGMVVRASEVKPFLTKLAYRCIKGHSGVVEGNIKRCPECNESIEVDPNKSVFTNLQLIRLQELPEDLPPGQLPHYSDVKLTNDLVDNARPGDRIILTGIVRAEQDIESKTNLFYRIKLDGNNIEFAGARMGDTEIRTNEKFVITKDDEKQIRRFANQPNAYERLIASMAPHVYGHDIVKEAILLLIVGAPQRELEDGTKMRGDINVLLVGDPGIAKSELLKYTARVAPRGLYTSGRGSTAAGLTAAVIRDKSGMMMLEAGAVVLGDQGLVCIDEFDKLRPEDRSALHEVMEQQSCSVAKGGIVATLNARTSILAAANPLLGKYDPYRNITENVNLPIPLLTRFDLIFAIRDEPNKEYDSNIARHILGLYRRGSYEYEPILSIDMLSKYLAYAKRINPVLSKEAEDKIFEYYLQMRNVDSEGMITVTPRQLEALIRLASARARLLLKEVVDASDAERAIYLFNKMLNTVGVDVKTGKVDLGVLHGMPQSERSKRQLFFDIFKALAGPEDESVEREKLVEELVKTGRFSEDEANELIDRMNREGVIYETKAGYYKRT